MSGPDQGSHQDTLYRAAQAVLPGGVSSSIRLNRALGRPFYVSRGEGAYLYDLDGRQYVDMLTAHGAALLGHKHPGVHAAVEAALACGAVCGTETGAQSRVAQALAEIVPCIDMVRFTCSGTEATMHTLRLAREYAGREKFIKFDGHFHGYHDYVMWNYGGYSPADGPAEAPRRTVKSGGIPAGIAEYVILLPFNDLEAVRRTLRLHGHEIAAIILEPIHYNAGCIVPSREYMQGLRALATEHGVVLIYDEILTAFRTGLGCAQAYFDIVPDLCTIGKCVAGGMPAVGFGGRREIMEHLRPLGNAEHSGTYNANLVPIMAAEASLAAIRAPGSATTLRPGGSPVSRDERHLRTAQLPGALPRARRAFRALFRLLGEVRSYPDTAKQDAALGLKFFAGMTERGVYFCDGGGKPSHHGFSIAHTAADIDRVLQATEDTVKAIPTGR